LKFQCFSRYLFPFALNASRFELALFKVQLPGDLSSFLLHSTRFQKEWTRVFFIGLHLGFVPFKMVCPVFLSTVLIPLTSNLWECVPNFPDITFPAPIFLGQDPDDSNCSIFLFPAPFFLLYSYSGESFPRNSFSNLLQRSCPSRQSGKAPVNLSRRKILPNSKLLDPFCVLYFTPPPPPPVPSFCEFSLDLPPLHPFNQVMSMTPLVSDSPRIVVYF